MALCHSNGSSSRSEVFVLNVIKGYPCYSLKFVCYRLMKLAFVIDSCLHSCKMGTGSYQELTNDMSLNG